MGRNEPATRTRCQAWSTSSRTRFHCASVQPTWSLRWSILLLSVQGSQVGFVAEPELIQERGRLAQLGTVQAFGEPLVDGRQQLAGFVMTVRGLPQSRQRDRGAQLERARALSTRDVERAAVGLFSRANHRRSGRVRSGQQELPTQTMNLGFPVAFVSLL